MIGVGCIIWKNELLGIDIMMLGKVIVYASVVLSLHSGWVYFKNYEEADMQLEKKEDE